MATTALEVVKKWAVRLGVALAMVLVQVIVTGQRLLTRAILTSGPFIFALMAYRFLVAALFIAPFAFKFERDNLSMLKKSSVWLCLFFNAAWLTLSVTLFYYGLRDTTAAYAINLIHLIPIITYLLYVIFRMKVLRLGSMAGKAKIAGFVLCAGGAWTTALYKGPAFKFHMHLLCITSKPDWTRGTLLLIGSCFSYAIFYILQVELYRDFPLKCWTITITCIIASAQSTMAGLFIDRRAAVWRLSWNLELFAIFYYGAVATGATFCLLSWAISKGGRIYTRMFNPLAMIFVVVLEALVLGTEIYLGTILGMVLIMLGFYSYMLGKIKEAKMRRLPSTNAAAHEQAKVVPEPIGMESAASATAVPDTLCVK